MNKKLIFKLCAVVNLLSGIVILFSVLAPMVSYELVANQRYPLLLSPLAEKSNYQKPNGSDYTKASNWFIGDDEKDFITQKVKFFTISIPKLRIDNARVAIGGEDLSDNLVQYPGTGLPGKIGNSVIFGHSILPIFYDPQKYISIFSTLNKLDKGDEIFVNYDGISYKYQVENMFEVKPSDIQILEQTTSHSILSLVTCTPMGDPRKPKRLIVRSRLVPLEAGRPNVPMQANANIGY